MINPKKIIFSITVSVFIFTGFLFLSDISKAQECDLTSVVFSPSGTQAQTWFNRGNRPSFTVTLQGNGNCSGKVIPEVSLVNVFGGNNDVEALNNAPVIFSAESNQVVFIFRAGEEGCTAFPFRSDCQLKVFARSDVGSFWSDNLSGSRGVLRYECDNRFRVCDNSLTFQLLSIRGGRISGQDVPLPPGGVPGDGGGGPGDGGGQPGESIVFEISPPGGYETLTDLVKAIARFLLQIAIPIAVIIIIYAGLLFLTSQGNKEKIVKARQALLYAVIGLAIILIGQGFVTLIKSILDLGR